MSDLSEIWQNLNAKQKEEYQKKFLCEKEKHNIIKNSKELREFESKESHSKEDECSNYMIEEKKEKKKNSSIESFFSDYSRFLEAKKKLCSS